MLNDARGFSRVFIATDYPDLRKGIDGLVWEGDGFLLLYKRLNLGSFRWPRSTAEALEITPAQYGMLMQGLEIVARKPIRETHPTLLCLAFVQNAENIFYCFCKGKLKKNVIHTEDHRQTTHSTRDFSLCF